MSNPTQASKDAVFALTRRLIEVASEAVDDGIAGSSLLSAYVTFAMQRPERLSPAVRAIEIARRVLVAGIGVAAEESRPENPDAARISELAKVFLVVGEHQDHSVVLNALQTAFTDLLGQHPCCMEGHAAHLLEMHKKFTKLAAHADASADPRHVH